MLILVGKKIFTILRSNILFIRVPMEFPIKFETVHSTFIEYIERSKVIIFKKTVIFLSLKSDFALLNSADPDEMPPYLLYAKVPV